MAASHEQRGQRASATDDASQGAVRFGGLVGTSAPMRHLFELLTRAAQCDATLLIEGERGTGKEVSAHAVHENSARAHAPFVVVDCGAIPGQLMESELFGYERGAFTGVVSAREGAFAAANGGTIFLDEIGELSLDLQPKLLRVLESRKVKRVGSDSYAPVDVRVIAATHRDLRAEVAAERFRSDLYDRLAVLHIKVPALRERTSDMPELVDDVLTQLGVRAAPLAEPIRDPAFIEMLASYRWPGNVRQLRNYLERRVALDEHIAPPGSESLTPPQPRERPSDGPRLAVDLPLRVARQEWISAFEKRYLQALLQRHNDNVSDAAHAAGVNRVHLYRLLWKYGLRQPDND